MAALLSAVAVLLLGACGTQVAGGAGGAPGSPGTPTATGPIRWTTFEPSAVTGARLSGDRRTLTLDVQVPKGPHACVRDLRAVLTEPVENSVRVQVTYSSPSGDRDSGCTGESTATARVKLAAPLGGQDVVVDHDTLFTTDGAALPALRSCGRLGCHPAPTGCTPDSYDQALMAVDAPKHTYRDSQKCDGKWLVLEFSWRTGPACGDDTKGTACSSRLGDRWFFRAEKSGWVPITEGAGGGCAAVHREAPAFPASMCDGLAPLSPSLHPSYPPASASAHP